MRRATWRWSVIAVAAACLAAPSARLVAIETPYGEDPVPDTRCYKGFLELGYGIDPIPAKTLGQRWQEWRAGRGSAPRQGAPHDSRPAGSSARARTTLGRPPEGPSARRVQRTSAARR
jgi:hypothetical protein